MQPTHKSCVEEWNSLPWKQFEKIVFRLQYRIYKAYQNKDYNLVNRLQRCLASSRAAKLLAIRQVTQLNQDKKTAGIDKKIALTEKERLQIFKEISNIKGYKHSKLKLVFIPKSNGEKRPLGIPTIKDRAIQCFIKYALEPVYEAYASRSSYGFRPARSTWDIQKNIFINLKSDAKGITKQILELDIEKCFDKINHEKLMAMVQLPQNIKSIVWSALKAGVLKERPKRIEGTQQGGIISPLLCNIALDGIEDIWNERIHKNKIYQRGFRYADDMVFFIKCKEDAELLRKKIDLFLAERGLNVKESKTKLVKSTEGFDFLGWHFKVKAKNEKFVSYPSKKNRIQVFDKIKQIIKDPRFKIEERLDKIKIIYKGWRNYHQFSDMGQINASLWKISDWVYKYCKKLNNKKNRVQRSIVKLKLADNIHSIFNGHEYKVNGFTSVQSDKSIYDNDCLYWSKRVPNRFYGQLTKQIHKEKAKCANCNLYFKNDDIIELNHIDGNHKNNQYINLMALHRSCHQK
uniref:putative reverse transcriptase/maturase n=1 Tax=Porphyridium aerugineum TaxID=2792 RepID=UPI001FCD8C26|nr:putative reverse transcriptase/maturase [Porphyridium aerugineum]UNJ17869.1 putative reverse transcriptase/maturase [Porphyridium aerugineum]